MFQNGIPIGIVPQAKHQPRQAQPAENTVNHLRGKPVVQGRHKKSMHFMIKRCLSLYCFEERLIGIWGLRGQFLSAISKSLHRLKIAIQRVVFDRFNFEYKPHLKSVVYRLLVNIEYPDAALRDVCDNTFSLEPLECFSHRAHGHFQKFAEFSLRYQLGRMKQAVVQSIHEFVMGQVPNCRMRGYFLIGFAHVLPGDPCGGTPLVTNRNSRYARLSEYVSADPGKQPRRWDAHIS